MDQHGCFVVELGLGLQTHLGASPHPPVLHAPKAGLCRDSVEVGSERPRRLSKVAQLQRSWASQSGGWQQAWGEAEEFTSSLGGNARMWQLAGCGVKVGEMPRLLGWGRWSSFGTGGPCRWVDSWVHI